MNLKFFNVCYIWILISVCMLLAQMPIEIIRLHINSVDQEALNDSFEHY